MMHNFTLYGFNFQWDAEQDSDMGPPWKEHDGHGPVRDVYSYYQRPDKKPGERLLHSERGEHWLYDWQGAMELARRDGWGMSEEARAEFIAKHGRAPTAGEVAAHAVQQDFDFLTRYCNGQETWECLCVTLLDVAGEPVPEFREYLGGILGADSDYLESEAHGLAEQIVSQLRAKLGRKKTLTISHGARVERVRVRK